MKPPFWRWPPPPPPGLGLNLGLLRSQLRPAAFQSANSVAFDRWWSMKRSNYSFASVGPMWRLLACTRNSSLSASSRSSSGTGVVGGFGFRFEDFAADRSGFFVPSPEGIS
ncbi:MAG: hypothetical protein JWR89_5150 [Tardiphaga sp.]|nr:hypothetical protein [Tardiphaga sp.]